jgi:hypothetical protein
VLESRARSSLPLETKPAPRTGPLGATAPSRSEASLLEFGFSGFAPKCARCYSLYIECLVFSCLPSTKAIGSAIIRHRCSPSAGLFGLLPSAGIGESEARLRLAFRTVVRCDFPVAIELESRFSHRITPGRLLLLARQRGAGFRRLSLDCALVLLFEPAAYSPRLAWLFLIPIVFTPSSTVCSSSSASNFTSFDRAIIGSARRAQSAFAA